MIRNLPEYAKDYKYIVYRICDDGEKWFWGAWNDFKKAEEARREIDGYIKTQY